MASQTETSMTFFESVAKNATATLPPTSTTTAAFSNKPIVIELSYTAAVLIFLGIFSLGLLACCCVCFEKKKSKLEAAVFVTEKVVENWQKNFKRNNDGGAGHVPQTGLELPHGGSSEYKNKRG